MVLIEVAFAITLRNIRRIIINDLSIKSVKAFPTTFQLCCHLTLLSYIHLK